MGERYAVEDRRGLGAKRLGRQAAPGGETRATGAAGAVERTFARGKSAVGVCLDV